MRIFTAHNRTHDACKTGKYKIFNHLFILIPRLNEQRRIPYSGNTPLPNA